MKKHDIFIALSMIVMVLFTACNPDVNKGPGSVKVLIDPALDSRTIGSNVSLVTDRYRLEAVPETGDKITVELAKTEKSKTLELNAGKWTITVFALNPSGKDIGSGSASVTVNPGALSECSVTVREYEGKGTLSLRLSGIHPSWNITATLSKSLDDPNPVEYKLERLGNTYYGSQSVEKGSYLLNIYNSGAFIWSEAIDIVANAQTNADVMLTEDGDMVIKSAPDMDSFSVSHNIVAGEIENGKTYTFTSTAPATWFIDGVAQSGEPVAEFVFKPVDMNAGNHKICALVDNGTYARIHTIDFTVAGEIKEITLIAYDRPLPDKMSVTRLGYTINLTISEYDAATTYKVFYDGVESTAFKHVDGVYSILALNLDVGRHTFRVDGIKDGNTITGKTYSFDVEEGLVLRPFHPLMNEDGTVTLSVVPATESAKIPVGGTYTWKIWNNEFGETPAVNTTTSEPTLNWKPGNNRTDGKFSVLVEYVSGDYKATTTVCIHYFLPRFEIVKPVEIRVGETHEFSIVDRLSVVDPNAYTFEWKLNGNVIEGAIGPKASIKVLQEGYNNVEVSYYAKSDTNANKEKLASSFTAGAEIIIPETRDFQTWYDMVSGCLFGTSDKRPGRIPNFTRITPEELKVFDKTMKAAMVDNPYGIEPVRCLIDPDTKDFTVEFNMFGTSRYVINQRTDGSWYGFICNHHSDAVERYSTMDLSGSSRTPGYSAYWNKLPAEILNGPVLVELERVWNPDTDPAPIKGVGVVLYGGTDVKAEAQRYAEIIGAELINGSYRKHDGDFEYSIYDYANTVCIDVDDYVDPAPDLKYSYKTLFESVDKAMKGIGKMPDYLFMNMSNTELRQFKRDAYAMASKQVPDPVIEVLKDNDGFSFSQKISNKNGPQKMVQNVKIRQDSKGLWSQNMNGKIDGIEINGEVVYAKPDRLVVIVIPLTLDVSMYGTGTYGGESQEMVAVLDVPEATVRKILDSYSIKPDTALARYYEVGDIKINGFHVGINVSANDHSSYGVSINYTWNGIDPSAVGISLNITDTIEPLLADDWLTAVSYAISAVGKSGQNVEMTVTDISEPVILKQLKRGESYEITVNALNSSGSVIGSGTATVKGGCPSADIVISERNDNGTVSVVLNGFASDAVPTVKYGNSAVEMSFASGAWKGVLDAPAGKAQLVLDVAGIHNTFDVRVVSGRTTDVIVAKENGYAGIVVENTITKTPELVITELQKWNSATRTFKLSAAVPGYKNAEFTWNFNGYVQTGKETLWEIPAGYSGYIYVNVITKCGDLFVSGFYELQI